MSYTIKRDFYYSFQSIRLAGSTVVIEMIRRREIYVLIILALIICAGFIISNLVGVDNPSTATLLLNLGMTFAYYAAFLLTLLTAIRQIPKEMENRTIYPLLAKPIRRGEYILGKWFAVTSIGISVFLILFTLVWILAPKTQQFNSTLLFQTLTLLLLSLLVISALSMLISLMFPIGVSIVLLGFLVIAGDKFVSFIHNRVLDSSFDGIVNWSLSYIPNFSNFNLITRYTDGVAPLQSLEFAGLIIYGAILIAISIFMAIALFIRRRL